MNKHTQHRYVCAFQFPSKQQTNVHYSLQCHNNTVHTHTHSLLVIHNLSLCHSHTHTHLAVVNAVKLHPYTHIPMHMHSRYFNTIRLKFSIQQQQCWSRMRAANDCCSLTNRTLASVCTNKGMLGKPTLLDCIVAK